MNRIYFTLLLLVSVISISLNASAQQSISGVVSGINEREEATPLVGATVMWEGTTKGVITDDNGEFTLHIVPQKRLIIAYVGYTTKSIDNATGNNLDITLNRGEDLEGITVVERRKSNQFESLNPIQTQKLTTSELARCACCNLSESFETNATVDVAYVDAVSGVKAIKMLGLSGRYCQMFIENIPILRGAENSFGLDYVPGTWMNGIQISKGTSAVKNGFESITGQINLDFKDPSISEFLSVYGYANLDGKLESNIEYSTALGEKWGATILLHGETIVREMDSNDDGFLDKPQTTQGNAMARFSYIGDKLTWKFGLSLLEEKREGGQVDYNHDLTRDEQPDIYGIGVDAKKIFGYSKSGYIFDRKATSIGLILSYNNFENDRFYGDKLYDSEQQNIYANLIYQSYIGDLRHTFNIGVSNQYDENLESLIAPTLDHVGFKETVTGAFAEYSYLPNDDFSIMGGIRYDYSSLYGGFVTPRFHMRYKLLPTITVRVSGGKGFRTASAIAENASYLASSREIVLPTQLDGDGPRFEQEQAWNYGASISNTFEVAGRDLSVMLDFYRTDFDQQLIVDPYQSNSRVEFYDLDGESYSNSFQVEFAYELFNRFDLTGAYRLNDVKSTFHGELREAPLVTKNKGLLSGSYSTNLKKWQFDLTAQFNGTKPLSYVDEPGRPEQHKRPSESENFTVLMGQVTKNYRNWSFYVGGENLTSFTQEDPIIASEDPYGEYFDASQVWGPIYGRMFYMGIKYSIDKD